MCYFVQPQINYSVKNCFVILNFKAYSIVPSILKSYFNELENCKFIFGYNQIICEKFGFVNYNLLLIFLIYEIYLYTDILRLGFQSVNGLFSN